MASIYPKRGKLYLSYYERIRGKSVRKQIALGLTDTSENRKKAEITKKSIELELLKPKPILSHYFPLSHAFEQFMSYKDELRSTSRNLYRLAFEYFIEACGDLFCSDVNEDHVHRYKRFLRKDKSETSVSIYFRNMNHFFVWLHDKGYSNKVTFPRIKPDERPIRRISDDQWEKILEEMNEDERYFFNFMLLTGFRITEAIDVHWQHFAWDYGYIEVQNTKGKRAERKADKFPIHEELEDFLRPHIQEEGKLFHFSNRQQAWRVWNKHVDRLRYDFTPHDIRKTFGSRLVNSGCSIYDASALLRHKDIRETMKYYTELELKRLSGEVNKVKFQSNFKIQTKKAG